MAKEKSRAEATANFIRRYEQYNKYRSKMQDKTHVTRLFDYLWFNDSITPMECFFKLGNTRISSTVSILRHEYGVPIRTEMVSKNGKKYGVYSLDKEALCTDV